LCIFVKFTFSVNRVGWADNYSRLGSAEISEGKFWNIWQRDGDDVASFQAQGGEQIGTQAFGRSKSLAVCVAAAT